VLASSVAMGLLFWAWQPMPGTVFQVESEAARIACTALFASGVMLVLYSTFLIDHFDLFGLRQVVLHFRGRDYEEKRFQTPSLYRHIRHPLYVGWFVTFWATPHMTWGHLLFASVASGYILVAIVFEERDLLAALGADYRAWREATPKFLPALRRRRNEAGHPASA
jgi:protein-S-isoprenylcysteine O-methyltransferase Ste14